MSERYWRKAAGPSLPRMIPLPPCKSNSRDVCELHVFSWRFDWLPRWSMFFVIGQMDPLGFGFTTLDWKPSLWWWAPVYSQLHSSFSKTNSGADPGFFLFRSGCTTKEWLTDWWGKHILKVNTKKKASYPGGGGWCAFPALYALGSPLETVFVCSKGILNISLIVFATAMAKCIAEEKWSKIIMLYRCEA